MKKMLYSIFALLVCNLASATTYYWIGGTSATSFTSQTLWTTDPVVRTPVGTSGALTIGTTDVFIFDGNNVGGATVVTGAVKLNMSSLNATPFAQLKFINGANVSLGRASTGSSNITLNGDGTSADDLVVDATSTLTLGIDTADHNVQMVFGANATGLISGKVYISPISSTVHTRSYITVPTAGSLVFATGSQCHITDSTVTSGFNASGASSIIFKTGASLYYYSGRSPIGNNSTTQFVVFEPGSNFYIKATNRSYVDGTTLYTSSSWTAGKNFANVYIQNGSTYTSDGAPNKIENFTIDNGCTFITHTSGQTPVLGNLIVEGTFSVPTGSTNGLVMGGNTPQTISGAGSIVVPTFVVCENSDVTLSKNITVNTTTNIVGKINFGTANAISGTSTFISRVNGTAAGVTGTLVAGSYQITGVAGTLSGNTGLTVAGAGIDANTNVVGFSNSNGLLYLSKPILTSGTAVALTFSSVAATLATANPNGFDSLTGCVTVTGTKSFGSGTNYILNAATTHPIGISSTATTSMIVGNITLNASVTTNYNTRVTGTVTLNNGKFTIRPTDTVRVFSGNDIAGFPFSSSKYIVTANSGNNVGVLRIDTFNTVKAFPVGTVTDYLPVKLAPTDFSNFCVSAFQGVTNDATPTGTAFTAGQKTSVVDAVWLINRTKGTGICDVNLYWVSSLEGSDFANFADNQIGISRYDGTNWTTTTALGANNTANFANDTFNVFSAFGVGKLGNLLPVKLSNVNAQVSNNSVNVSWTATNEINIEKYIIEKSIDGRMFSNIGSLISLNNINEKKYSFIENGVAAGNYYYRIVVIGKDGSKQYSNILKISIQTKNAVSVYPNPANNEITIAGITLGSTIQFINILGKIAHQQIVISQAKTIDITQLSTGIWTIKVTQPDGISTTTSFIKIN